MTYSEAVHTKVTRTEARREVKRHGASWEEFISEYGDHDTYRGADVLGWLGY